MSEPARQDSELREENLKVLTHSAIEAALAGNWEEALSVNKKVLSQDPLDVGALNRLARAQLETGKLKEAKITLKKVLKIDKFNSIALRLLKRLAKGKRLTPSDNGFPSLSPDFFLEEPGKTRTITLLHLGDPRVVSAIDPGDPVNINCQKHRVSITNGQGGYLGRLPDDIALRLIRLVKNGNIYQARVKLSDPDNFKVFIREVERSQKLKDYPSFPPPDNTNYVAYTPPEIVHPDRPEIETLEEGEAA